MNLSVIVPVWNEAAAIGAFISHLWARLPDAELVLVDGGSGDDTWAALQSMRDPFSLRLLRAPRGRAAPMNAGASAASGETLLFLHADSRVPIGCGEAILTALADTRCSGGCFRLCFPRPEWIYRVSDSLGNLAVDLFRIGLGDHGIFCRRKVFDEAGGYPLVPLLEDAEFYRRLGRFGRVRQLPLAVETSPRRYEVHGPYRTTLFYLFILMLYLMKVSPHLLARWHRRVMQPAETPRSRLGRWEAAPTAAFR
ncbi:TIGR04283 family arsenosugar biosynthesis glycosyltransferase [soil metagenome]